MDTSSLPLSTGSLRIAINSGGGAVIGGVSSAALDLLHGAAINMENAEKNAAITAITLSWGARRPMVVYVCNATVLFRAGQSRM